MRVLYWSSVSPYAFRARIALREKGLLSAFQESHVDLRKGEQKKDSFLKLNPRGKVPVLVDGTTTVSESLAVALHLEMTYPDHGNRLLPEYPDQRAAALQKMMETASLTDAGSPLLRYYLFKAGREEDIAGLKAVLSKELQVWEKYASRHEYISGTAFSVADVALYPSLKSLVRFGVDLKHRPSLGKYLERVEGRSSVQDAFPTAWKTPLASQPLHDV